MTKLASIYIILNDDTFYRKLVYSLNSIKILFYNFIRDYNVKAEWMSARKNNLQALTSSVILDKFNSSYDIKNISDNDYVGYIDMIKKIIII